MLKRIEVVAKYLYFVKSSTVCIPLIDCEGPEFLAIGKTPFFTL